MRKSVHILLIMLLACLTLAGCSDKKEIDENKTYVYYLNSSATALYPVETELSSGDTEKQVAALMDSFMTVPADVDALPAPEDKVEYIDFTIESGVLNLYFDSNFAEMQPSRRTLCVAALVYTMTQADGVDYVSIFSGEQPLTDSEGNVVRPLSRSDFIDSVSDVNAFDKAELELYFTDEKGEYLIAEKRTLMYSMNNSLEKVALTELIKGPRQEGLRNTLPEGTDIASISSTDGTCYVNFSSDVTQLVPELKSEISIYSIVNTLTSLPNISRVQISYGDNQGEVYERNLDIIEGEEK